MDKPVQRIKLFGISNQLLETALDRVEAELALDLGRNKQGRQEKDWRYYQQFDLAVRQEAARMARHYEVFYCLEQSIRKMITEMLESVESGKWWGTKRIPQNIFDEVASRMKKERDAGVTVRSDEPIDYTNFGELGEIIKKNWDVFGSVFASQRAVEKVMNSLNVVRGPIAHCSPLSEDEVVRLRLSVKDWFRLME
jgi:Swt1-like HEPN